jgi:hypothetical protein
MPNRTLAIVFRNPHPQRSQIRTGPYLFRRNGSVVHIDYYTNQGEFRRPEGVWASADRRSLLCGDKLRLGAVV